jgi:hypothetical protein
MQAAQQGFVFELLVKEHLLVSFQGSAPSSEDWDRYLTALSTLEMKALRCLIYVDGAAPSPAYLQRIANIVRGNAVTAALVSPSLALRFAVSAFSLVTRNIRYFMPTQLDDALAHLRCTAAEAHLVQETLQRLQRAH